MNAFLECFRGPLKTLWQAHRRTRQGFGGAAAAPGLKNFRANFVFQGKRKLLKTPENKKYIFSTVNLGHPLLFRASASCSKLLNVKSIFNTVKNFRANSVFQGKRKLLKTPENKKYIFSTVNLGHPLLFRASASCSKLLNVKSIFNTVKKFRATLFFRASASCSKTLNYKNISIE